MRIIKFRGFTNCLVQDKWVYGFLSEEDKIRKTNLIDYEVDNKTIGQFTGLYDIEGEEIYEGDIVEKAVNNIISSRRFKIVYSECFASFCRLYIKKKGTRDGLISLSEMDIDRDKIKVIGNIHDTPELLKQ